MKTFKSLWLLAATVLSLSVLSCKKQDSLSGAEKLSVSQKNIASLSTLKTTTSLSSLFGSTSGVVSLVSNPASGVSFCAELTVPFCTPSGPVGSVNVKRGADNNIYITCSLSGSNYFTSVELYAGPLSGVPVGRGGVDVSRFPFKKSFTSYTAQSYQFVLSGLTDSFSVAAHASLVSITTTLNKRTQYTQNTAWADGCSGKNIIATLIDQLLHGKIALSALNYSAFSGTLFGATDTPVDPSTQEGGDDISSLGAELSCNSGDDNQEGGDDHQGEGDHENNNDDHQEGGGDSHASQYFPSGDKASFFSFSGSNCLLSLAAIEQTLLCSQPIPAFFDADITGYCAPWIPGSVSVAGFTYSESEGRNIRKSADPSGVTPDSKYAFLRVATLKLSYTDYSQSATLAPAVATVEAWLQGLGKLTPSHLPGGNAQARAAAEVINAWIDAHNCPGR
jgi:hypothetical protein